jgi:hypothetical protein
MTLEWKTPPAPGPHVRKWEPIVEELRHHAGEWAILKRIPGSGRSARLAGTAGYLRRVYHVEVLVRSVDDETLLFGRIVEGTNE